MVKTFIRSLCFIATLFMIGCSSQPEIRYMTYTHSNGRVEVFPYVVPSTPGYVDTSTTTVYKDARGAVIGYGITSGPSR